MIFAALGGALFKTATAKVIGGLAGAALDTVMQKKQVEKQNQAQEAAYQRQLEAERLEAEKNRALAKSDAANKFTDMSAAAQKAGINPLTALRTTGAAGFGNYGGFASQAVAPVLSKFSFARTFASNVGKAYFERKINEPIDKYNKQIRDLELQQRKLDVALTRGQIGSLASPAFKDPMQAALAKYRADPLGWTKMLDIRGKPIEVKNMILERLKLLPGQTYGLAEDMEALAGEIGGEFQGIGNIGDTFKYPVSRKVTPFLSQDANTKASGGGPMKLTVYPLLSRLESFVDSVEQNRQMLRAR